MREHNYIIIQLKTKYLQHSIISRLTKRRYVGQQMSHAKFLSDRQIISPYTYRRRQGRQVVDQCSLWKERPQSKVGMQRLAQLGYSNVHRPVERGLSIYQMYTDRWGVVYLFKCTPTGGAWFIYSNVHRPVGRVLSIQMNIDRWGVFYLFFRCLQSCVKLYFILFISFPIFFILNRFIIFNFFSFLTC